ncbi:hypothetical protein [Limnobacter sp.]|uniref:hypothetical protein n=1 Tax=Limnobacter sp. TaxID=2003368 RepID=UPI003518D969
MFDLPKAGVYVVRANQAETCATRMVEHWLRTRKQERFKSCLWMSASPQHTLRAVLEPHLSSRRRAPKGLDVVSVRQLLKHPQHDAGVRTLCRSLDTLLVLKPALVIIERADLWFNNPDLPVEQRNPLEQMRLLHQWARYANAHVLLPVEGELPNWGVFADGLADVSDALELEFRPWWPSAHALQSDLWNEPGSLPALTNHKVVDLRLCPSLGAVARLCHSLRFEHAGPLGVHVVGAEGLNSRDASVLLRMGADTVLPNEQDLPECTGVPTAQLQHLDSELVEQQHTSDYFAKDLHEVFMPGMVRVLPAPLFARQGFMLLTLATHWDVHCTVTRLSLMPHMTAKTALKLADWANSACVYTATREALYSIKLWPSVPDEATYRAWLESCFREALPALFSGDVLFEGVQRDALLRDLHEELEPLNVGALLDDDLQEADLEVIWGNESDAVAARPWSARLDALLKGVAS